MGRQATIDSEQLVQALTDVFRDVGYEGTSLGMLEKATGLKRASLYHRFPQGKEQMAHEVISEIDRWIKNNIITTLRSDAPPAERIESLKQSLRKLYSNGKHSCILNTLSSPQGSNGLFSKEIKSILLMLTDGLAGVVSDAGYDKKESCMRAERVIMLLQGSLVVSRGIGSQRPFRDVLNRLQVELLG